MYRKHTASARASTHTTARPLTLPDRLPFPAVDRFVYCVHQTWGMHLHYILSLAGRLDFERLCRAVELSLAVHPVLGCTLGIDPDVPVWERRTDGFPEMCTAVEIEAAQQEAARLRFLETPMDPYREPQLQVRLLRHDTDTLCLKINHLATDAAGVKQYAALLAEIYQRLAADPGYIPQRQVGENRGLGRVRQQFTLPQQLAILVEAVGNARAVAAIPVRPMLPFRVGAEAGPSRCLLKRLSSERLQAIKSFGHQHRATVNDVLLAAFYRSLCAAIPAPVPNRLALRTTVDLRRYLPDKDSSVLANLSTVIAVPIACMAGASFEQTVVAVRDEMNARKQGFLGLASLSTVTACIEGIPFQLFRRLLGSRTFVPSSGGNAPVLTNMGIIDPETLDFDGLAISDAFLVPSIPIPPLLFVGVSTFREVLTFSVSFHEGFIAPEAVRDLLDRMDRVLPGGDSTG